VHNHPSGDPTPSRADVEMTRAIVEVARPLGIAVHDHIIVGKDGHASLKGLKLNQMAALLAFVRLAAANRKSRSFQLEKAAREGMEQVRSANAGLLPQMAKRWPRCCRK